MPAREAATFYPTRRGTSWWDGDKDGVPCEPLVRGPGGNLVYFWLIDLFGLEQTMLQTAIFITAMVWSLTAGAEAYQCTLPDGRTVYQQAPCDAAPQPLDPNTQDTGTGGRRPSEREFLDERAQSNRQKQEGATTGTPNPKAQECAAGARPLAGGKKPDRHPDPHQRHGQRRV